jgi:hypothetical protein
MHHPGSYDLYKFMDLFSLLWQRVRWRRPFEWFPRIDARATLDRLANRSPACHPAYVLKGDYTLVSLPEGCRTLQRRFVGSEGPLSGEYDCGAAKPVGFPERQQ